jgi:hypothetical protein
MSCVVAEEEDFCGNRVTAVFPSSIPDYAHLNRSSCKGTLCVKLLNRCASVNLTGGRERVS